VPGTQTLRRNVFRICCHRCLRPTDTEQPRPRAAMAGLTSETSRDGWFGPELPRIAMARAGNGKTALPWSAASESPRFEGRSAQRAGDSGLISKRLHVEAA